jgi:hypothetical protein
MNVAIRQWEPIATAPDNQVVEVAVLEAHGYHAFACRVRRMENGWVIDEDETKGAVPIDPTHWRDCPNDH